MSRYIVHVNERYEHLRPELEKIARDGMPSNAEVIYKGRNTLFRVNVGTVVSIIKSFKLPGALNSRIYTTLRKSKASRSYLNARKMIALGFRTPEPIACMEVRDGMKLTRSYYVSREIHAREMRHWEEHPDAEKLTEAFAAEILRLHRAGVYHRDFSPGNILYEKLPDGSFSFLYVDLNRMEFGVTSRRKLMSMFKSINLNRPEMIKLARSYAAIAGEDPEKVVAEALSAHRRYIRQREFKRKIRPKKK